LHGTILYYINPLKSRDLINHTRFAPLHVAVLH
jgi:hypothetical protein